MFFYNNINIIILFKNSIKNNIQLINLNLINYNILY